MTSNNSSVLLWMKKNYDELGEKFWYSYDLNDQAILRPFSKDVPKQLKKEAIENHYKILRELGLVEKEDSSGKKQLLNNLPIKTKKSQQEVSQLISRLSQCKSSVQERKTTGSRFSKMR